MTEKEILEFALKQYEENQILKRALKIGGQYARAYLPAEIPEDSRYFSILAEGDFRDPEGLDFVGYWLYQAKEGNEW